MSTIQHVKNVFTSDKFSDLQGVLISCGVNDIDRKSGNDVADEILELIKFINQSYPSVKIIVSEVTPRMDERDHEVKICNDKLLKSIPYLNNVIFVEQNNLRNPKFFS